jgi:hypothetical protein
MNPMATTAACIANGGKPSTDPCNILNPMATKAGCAASQAGNAVAKSGMPDWLKAVIAIGSLLLFVIVAIVVVNFNSPTVSGGGRRGGGRGGNRR